MLSRAAFPAFGGEGGGYDFGVIVRPVVRGIQQGHFRFGGDGFEKGGKGRTALELGGVAPGKLPANAGGCAGDDGGFVLKKSTT